MELIKTEDNFSSKLSLLGTVKCLVAEPTDLQMKLFKDIREIADHMNVLQLQLHHTLDQLTDEENCPF
tara:strand:- start:2908 stop:3111 length:204 start_codon:yes stop_codon:yes gene_type:complete